MALTPLVILAAAAPSATDQFLTGWGGLLPFLAIPILFYFMLWRPQAQRQKEHQARLSGIKRGDTIVMTNGMKGKVVRVEDAELGVEIAQNVTVKVVKSMVHDVQARGEPAPANDAKS